MKRTPFLMNTNLQTLHLSGTILLLLGVLIAVLSIGLFIAVSAGVTETNVVHDEFSFQHIDMMKPGLRERIVFLVPVVAGIMMAVSGVLIRSKVPEWKATFGEAREYFNSGEFSSGDGGHIPVE